MSYLGGSGQTGFLGSAVFAGRSRRACMYAFHSSGIGVSVATERRVTQSHSVSRLLRSARSSFHGWASMSSCNCASNSSFGGFSYPSGTSIDSHVSPNLYHSGGGFQDFIMSSIKLMSSIFITLIG